MERLDTESYTEFARKINLTSYEAPKRVRRWADGENDPDFEGTMLILEAVGWLSMDAPVRVGVDPAEGGWKKLINTLEKTGREVAALVDTATVGLRREADRLSPLPELGALVARMEKVLGPDQQQLGVQAPRHIAEDGQAE